MLISLLVLTLLAGNESEISNYVNGLHASLAKAAPTWAKVQSARLRGIVNKGEAVSLLEVDIGPDGAARALRLVRPSYTNQADDVARAFVFYVEPFSPPSASLLDARNVLACLVRISLVGGKRPALVPTVGCKRPGDAIGRVAGRLGTPLPGDAGAQLLAGWRHEAEGDAARAEAAYRRATTDAPKWGTAARALGLALVRAYQQSDAVPFLRIYVESHAMPPDVEGYAREIHRYDQQIRARLAETNRLRKRLSKKDLALGIKKGYPLLEPCLEQGRAQAKLPFGNLVLVFTWTVKKDGTVTNAKLVGPENLVMSGLDACLEGAVERWRFPPYSEGTEITVSRVPLKVRGRSPQADTVQGSGTAPQANAAAATLVDDEPSFSTCQRAGTEIGSYIRSRRMRVSQCVDREMSRSPNASHPESVPVTFVVDVDGSIRDVRVEHRFYREGPLSQCVGEALAGNMAPSGGADCPAEFSLDLHSLTAQR